MGFLPHLIILLTAASAVTVSADPRITSISFSGNGCPRDPKFHGGFNNPTVTFHNFAASLPGVNQTVNCQAHLQATGASPGWQVALKTNVVKGHVVLTPGTALNYITTVYFSQNADRTDILKGTVSNTGSSTINQAVTLVSQADNDKAWSPCIDSDGYTGIMNVNFRGALAGDGKAYFEALTEEWDLEWKRC